MFPVNVTFDAVGDYLAEGDKITKAAGRLSDASGTGFGQRDMSFYCQTEKEAKTIAKRISKIKDIQGLSVNVSEMDDF